MKYEQQEKQFNKKIQKKYLYLNNLKHALNSLNFAVKYHSKKLYRFNSTLLIYSIN